MLGTPHSQCFSWMKSFSACQDGAIIAEEKTIIQCSEVMRVKVIAVLKGGGGNSDLIHSPLNRAA